MSAFHAGRQVGGGKAVKNTYAPKPCVHVCRCGAEFMSELLWRQHRVSAITAAPDLAAALNADEEHGVEKIRA